MLKQIKLTLITGTLLLLLFSSCKKELNITIQNENQIAANDLKTLVNQAKDWHDSIVSSKISLNNENYIKSLSIPNDDITPPVINWSLAYKNFDSADIKSISVPLDFNISTGELFQFVATSKKDSVNGYLIRQIPDSAYYAIHPDVLDLSDFTGYYIVYDLLGHCLSKMKFSSGVVSSNSLSLKQSNSIKANSTAAPCSGCNLLTVIVYNSPTYLRNDYTKSFGGSAIISYNDALNVISGGSGTTSDMMTYLSFVSIPNGQCVFGSLAYLGTILGGNSDVSFYINQWAVENKVSPAQMTNSLINDSGSRPNGDGAIFLLTKNFISSRLSTTSDIINNAKLGLPIFVLIDWGNGSGHCVVVLWDDVKNNLYYYDSTQNPPSNYVPFDTNSDIFKKMKVFIAVTDSKI